MKRRFLALTMLLGLALAGPAFAQADQLLPVLGGAGGGRFYARCANGDILNGFEVRVGDDVDSIRPICVTAYAPNIIGPRHAFTNRFGGDGGTAEQLVCPDSAPAIAGLGLKWEGQVTIIVNTIHLYCSVAVPNQPMTPNPTAAFDGREIRMSDGSIVHVKQFVTLFEGVQTCAPGLVPVGITGRSGKWLDAFGLICGALRLDASKLPPPPVKSIGRVNRGSTPQGPLRSLCEAARDARARNSPAAANLEAQCSALPKEPVKSIGRVNTGTAPANPNRSLCEAARDARARNSPAAANLETQCRAAGGSPDAPSDAEMETARARGEAMAADDALARNLRNRLPEAAFRGFDIGLGIWQGNTAPGPGKQRYHDALIKIEQLGFDTAAAYALPRNKYAALIGVGAAIAGADAEVAAMRAAKDNVYYWLGVDIASALFGDPAAGAQGSKLLGADAMAIRNSLNVQGQSGFNDSMRLHLARTQQ